jgi:tRNA(Ile)-lysidine synthase
LGAARRRLMPDAPCVAVAYSGGRDSSALLHATLGAAADHELRVVALHVHHGLSAHADEWLAHCERQCRRWAARGLPIAFDHRRLDGRPPRGDSVEAWARRARYAALREMALAHRAPIVLLAHHRQDQAETVLLQALRGAGVAGLAAMPAQVAREGVTWMRPWLQVSPDTIAAYARRHRLRHVEDDSNADRRFARNRLRLEVWPALSAAFPQAEGALAATAAWALEARHCADDLAGLDLARIAGSRGLDLAQWSGLSQARRSNVLRAWLKAQTGASAKAATVERLLTELSAHSPAQWLVGGFLLRRYRGHLTCRAAPPGDALPSPGEKAAFSLTRAGTYPMPGWGGRLCVQRVDEGGVPMAMLAGLRLVERRGGEQFQLAPGRPARSLKKQFQSLAVPAWERGGPLIYCGEQLIYVPGLGIDARAAAAPRMRQASLRWLRDPVG